MDSDSEVEESHQVKFSKGAVGRVVLVDVRDPHNLGTPGRALDAVRATIRSEMRSGGVRLTSVCLCNAAAGVRGVVEVLPLTHSSLDDYRKLQEADATAHGQANACELADALWHCGRTFASCSRALSERSVVLLARYDDPPPKPQQRPALKRAVDLANLGIELRLINVSQIKYEHKPFYTDLLKASAYGRPGRDILPEPLWSISDIESQLKCRSHRLTASSHLHWTIGGDVKLAVGIYHLASKKNLPRKVALTKDRNELVSTNICTVRLSAPTSDELGPSGDASREVLLLKSELVFYQFFGAKKIEFKGEDLAAMKTAFGPPGIILLGFKPQSWLAMEKHYLQPCQFLFPDETSIEGSTRAFRALHSACEQRGVLAVCMLRARKTSNPRIVALWPCSHPLGLNVDVGFDIIHVPYLENRKEVPDPENKIATADFPAEVELMKNIVSKLKFKYAPDKFENPNLQSLYRAVEALALEEESVEPLIDTTKPSADKFEGIDSELIKDVFGPFEVDVAKKRPAPGSLPAPKRMANGEFDDELFISRLKSGVIHKYTVKELKDILYLKNPPELKALTGLKKDDLVNLVYQYCK